MRVNGNNNISALCAAVNICKRITWDCAERRLRNTLRSKCNMWTSPWHAGVGHVHSTNQSYSRKEENSNF